MPTPSLCFLELHGLQTLARELRDGTIPHARENSLGDPINFGFNMDYEGRKEYHCGTVACIGGFLRLRGQLRGTISTPTCRDLTSLFWPDEIDTPWHLITPAQAAQAIENFLATGEPSWGSIIQESRA